MCYNKAVIGIGLFLLLAGTCAANVPLVGAFGFGIPFLTALETFGISFVVIVLIEGLVIRHISKILWRRALWYSLIANAISTCAGIVVYGMFPTPLITDAAGYIATTLILSFGAGVGFYFLLKPLTGRRFFLILLSLIFTASIAAMIFIGSPIWPHTITWAYFSLFPAFLVTIVIEGNYLIRKMEKKKAIKAVLWGNVLSYILLLAIVFHYRNIIRNKIGVTIDYYSLIGEAAAKRGDVRLAYSMVEKARALLMDEIKKYPDVPYFPFAENRIIKILIQNKQYREAEALTSDTLSMKVNMAGWREGLENKLREIQKLKIQSQTR